MARLAAMVFGIVICVGINTSTGASTSMSFKTMARSGSKGSKLLSKYAKVGKSAPSPKKRADGAGMVEGNSAAARLDRPGRKMGGKVKRADGGDVVRDAIDSAPSGDDVDRQLFGKVLPRPTEAEAAANAAKLPSLSGQREMMGVAPSMRIIDDNPFRKRGGAVKKGKR